MKTIELTRGLVAIVDDWVYSRVNCYKWRAVRKRAGLEEFYAFRNLKRNEPQPRVGVYMHRLIAGTPPGLMTDHINGNTLDNQRHNLRAVSPTLNQFNRKVFRRSKSGVTGVNKAYNCERWAANIIINGKSIYLGCFKTLEEAKEARLMFEYGLLEEIE